jgi:DNA (cytosine-5)-methyltransferase 1
MKHLGDITKIHGDKIEPVDCITFGSPCQDLSIAGRRAGLAGERSGLFVEAVKIIKEMRKATNGMHPTFAIWENVPGAFSSNNGEDFKAVLEELARVAQPDVSIPRPSGRGGRWSKAGAIAGTGWSLAWRQLDAQYWGVPQRRKRIALVADFRGQRAAEILFERTSLSGNFDESIKAWEATPGHYQTSPYGRDRGGNSYTLKIRSGCAGGGKGALVQTEKSATLSTLQDQTLFQPVVYDARGNGDGKIVPTITGDHENRITDYTAIAIERKTFNEQSFSHYKESDKCSTLKAKAGNIGNGSECLVTEKTSVAVDVYNGAVTGDKTETLTCKNDGSSSGPLVAEKTIRLIVRRLTPVECERLQGYPDGWTDIGEWVDSKGKKHKYADSPRYKALGNSIALPQWFWIAQNMKPYLSKNATLGSLFDGIGGFPLIWQKTYGNGTARWASEVDSFCIAVTKRRFGEE